MRMNIKFLIRDFVFDKTLEENGMPIHFVVLFISAIMTHYFIAWVGGHLNTAGGILNWKYAKFTFSSEKNESMTTNILTNIFIPNVVMVFVYAGTVYLKWHDVQPKIWIFVVFYYVYRMLLICVFLRRKELYNFKYEILVAISGFILAFLLSTQFLNKAKTIFISADELREELWFAIIIVIYGFVKSILDDKVKQDDILTSKNIEKYIIDKFNKFYARYSKCIRKEKNNSNVIILLFAIMIYEDYNRGPEKRFVENIKVRLGFKTSVGIMQVKSAKRLSNTESVEKAYRMISDFVQELDYEQLQDNFVWNIAMKYNPDEKYADSVAYIYNVLVKCISEGNVQCNQIRKKDLQKNNRLPEKRKIKCGTMKEISRALCSNTRITLKHMKGNILDGINESPYITVEKTGSGWELILHDLDNVTINGNGSHLYSVFPDANVIVLRNCNNIVLRDFKFGHKSEIHHCEGCVLRLENTYNCILKKLNLYGCGAIGICADESEFKGEKLEIHHCTDGAIWCVGTTAEIEESKIYNCKKQVSNLISSDSFMKISNTDIFNNYMEEAVFDIPEQFFKCKNMKVYNNTYRKQGVYQKNEEEILWMDNKNLKWIGRK